MSQTGGIVESDNWLLGRIKVCVSIWRDLYSAKEMVVMIYGPYLGRKENDRRGQVQRHIRPSENRTESDLNSSQTVPNGSRLTVNDSRTWDQPNLFRTTIV